MASLSVTCKNCSTVNTIEVARVLERPTCPRCRQPLLVSDPVDVDPATFAAAIKESRLPVLAVLYSPWNTQSTMAAPAVIEVAKRHAGRLIVLQLNTQLHPQALKLYAASALPTMLLFKSGSEKKRMAGKHSPQEIDAFVAG